MKIWLVSPPTLTDFVDQRVLEDDYIVSLGKLGSLGVLTLAAVLESRGWEPQVVDLNQWYLQFRQTPQSDGDFALHVAQRLVALGPDLIGFGTICSSFPLTLRIADHVKSCSPRTVIVLGGPQASVTDVPTLKAFPAIDFVVRGEAEDTFPKLLAALAGRGPLEFVDGITLRQFGNVHRRPAAPVIENLDALPLPAFHLFPPITKIKTVSLELGRGCPFACKFCSTNDFFRRNFRLKSPGAVLGQMREMHRRYGITSFDLVHDMFTVDRRKVKAFCEHMVASNERFIWGCSARTDCVDEELIEIMAGAGCTGIFFGIETGSSRLQKIIGKNLDIEEARRMVSTADGHGISTAVSLISGFPEENEEDLRCTVDFFVDSMRLDHADPQLHLLAPLVETPIFTEFRESLILDEIVSDMSHQGWKQADADRALIAAHKEIFGNFYSVPTHLDRDHLSELREFLTNGAGRMRWLLVALHRHSGDLVKVFDLWREWRVARRTETHEKRGMYYANVTFAEDLLSFVDDVYLVGQSHADAIRTIVQYQRGLIDEVFHAEQEQPELPLKPPTQGRRQFALTDTPILADGVRVFHVDRDFRKIVECLRRKEDVGEIPSCKTTMVLRRSPEMLDAEILQVSELSGKLLLSCTGRTSILAIANSMETDRHAFGSVPPDKGCLFGFEMLRLQGLIAWAGPVTE